MADLIYTDDEANGLEWGYLGPKGIDLPEARPTAWITLICSTFAGWILVGASSWLFGISGWLVIGGVLAAPLVALHFTRKVMPHVNYYRPPSHWASVGRAELHAPRRSLEQSRYETETNLDPSIFKKGNHR